MTVVLPDIFAVVFEALLNILLIPLNILSAVFGGGALS